MDFDQTLELFMEKYSHINPEHHPQQFTQTFVMWFNQFRYTDEFLGIIKLEGADSDVSTDK
jgi:hypothetical protein